MKKIEKVLIKIITWLANKLDYKIIMVRSGDGEISIQGNLELSPYLNTVGYLLSKNKNTKDRLIFKENLN